MTTTETVTPPECCPVCGSTEDGRTFSGDRTDLAIEFGCGIIWHLSPAPRWSGDCYHATLAALRCGATLHPTAKETATAALVEACVAEHNAVLDTDAFNGNQLTDLYALRAARADAISARVLAVYAYLAAQEPRP